MISVICQRAVPDKVFYIYSFTYTCFRRAYLISHLKGIFLVYSGIDPKDGDDDDHQNDNDKIGSFLFNFVCFVGLRSSEGDRLLETERRVTGVYFVSIYLGFTV